MPTKRLQPDPIIGLIRESLERLDYLRTRILFTKRLQYPRFLYKFRRLQNATDTTRLREIIVRSELWLSSPETLNDPFDMSARLVSDDTVTARRHRIQKEL